VPAVGTYVSAKKSISSFPLVADGKAAALYASESDWPGVLRAIRDVQAPPTSPKAISPWCSSARWGTAP
jgi:hypothetical protein